MLIRVHGCTKYSSAPMPRGHGRRRRKEVDETSVEALLKRAQRTVIFSKTKTLGVEVMCKFHILGACTKGAVRLADAAKAAAKAAAESKRLDLHRKRARSYWELAAGPARFLEQRHAAPGAFKNCQHPWHCTASCANNGTAVAWAQRISRRISREGLPCDVA
eukprot:Skav222819  [mRNA]  locus=scaffold1444:214233:217003:+ [translate_table: standard]